MAATGAAADKDDNVEAKTFDAAGPARMWTGFISPSKVENTISTKTVDGKQQIVDPLSRTSFGLSPSLGQRNLVDVTAEGIGQKHGIMPLMNALNGIE